MNATRQTNTFSGGLNMDVDYSVLKDNQYVYAENIRILTNVGSSIGAMQNIEGFLKCDPTVDLINEKIIHVTTVRDWAIVFTKVNGGNFNVYRFDFAPSEEAPIVTKIINNKDLGIVESTGGIYAISSVCRWEAENNVKVYWVDGHKQTKVINVDKAHEASNANITEDKISIMPSAILPPFKFNGVGSGNLSSGMIQYCYQLFNSRGSETAMSELTPMFHLAENDQKSNYREVIGSSPEQNTGKSIKLITTQYNNGFDRAKIIALHYTSNTAVPTIRVIDDISVNGNTIQYEDKGSGMISELSIDEFNALTGYVFIPEVIEAKDNRLFAANITEETWDVEYDARAYRANSTGNIMLMSNSSSSINFAIGNVGSYDVPKDHDCICPYNVGNGDYKYTTNTKGDFIQGGKGKNVSYRFITTILVEDSSTSAKAPVLGFNEEFTFNSPAYNLSSLPVSYESGDKSSTISLTAGSKIFNYSNTEIDSKVKGYQRDEIYRFGIVLYNKYNMPSPVHWIGDIRMPSARDSAFDLFRTSESNQYGDSVAVTTKPLGIEFDVRNLPDSVTRYEIVRCERTLSDRTVLAQGIVSCVTNYDTTSNILVPFPYLAYSNRHGYISSNSNHSYTFNMSDYQSTNYFIFISPEICVNRENSSELANKFKSIDFLYELYSPIDSNAEWGINGTKVLANARSIKADGKNIVSTTTSSWQTHNGYVDSNCIVIHASDFYTALLAKYYAKNVRNAGGTATIDDAKVAEVSEPFWTNSEPWAQAATTIGDKVYYNWMWDNASTSLKEDANNVRKFGPHGICAVFKSNDMLSKIPLVNSKTYNNETNAVVLCNMKQNVSPYGGNSYTAIQNSVYIPTSANGTGNGEIKCFGGDTYIGILDYANGMFAFKPEDYEDGSSNRLFNGAFIPMESSINLALTHSDSSINRTYNAGNGYANHFVQNNIVQIGDLYSQNTPLYAYNDAYSAQSRAKKYVSKSMYNIDNLVSDTRILSSEVKTNNEVIDSWTKFKVANYLDLDTRFGPINSMRLFKNNLLFWQTDAFGTVAVNERSIITDNNPGALTLGTGGILDRYDYMTTLNGLSPKQLRAETQSDSTVYWYDSKRNEICGFSGQLQTVSKLKGVQSYLNMNKAAFKNDPIAVYDKKYNEVLFTLGNNTLAFNEQLGVFTSFYNYNPDNYAEFSDKLYLFKSLKLFKYNGGEKQNLDTNDAKVSEMVFVVNKDYPQTKTFDNVEYSGDFTRNTNFDLIVFDTKRQTSETLTSTDIDYREDTYKFAIPRNALKLNEVEQLANKSYKDRMKGKYLLCNYKYDCNEGNTFKVPYISTAYRYSMI